MDERLRQWRAEWAARAVHVPDEADEFCSGCGQAWPCAVEVERRETPGSVTWSDPGSGGGGPQ